jgi:hypothetical protein
MDEVWDSLVKELSKSFFVINNIEKESRIINVSFYTDSPEDYIDCGTTSRSWSGTKNKGNINYNSAEDSRYFVMYKWGAYNHLPAEALVHRKTSLEGRINIYVAPSGNGTLTTVNSRYIFNCDWTVNGYYYNAFGTLVNSSVDKGDYSNTFNTNRPNTVNVGKETSTCCSNGKLEQEILGFIE